MTLISSLHDKNQDLLKHMNQTLENTESESVHLNSNCQQ